MSEVAWIGSVATVAGALFFESRFFARGGEPSRRESILWSLGWVALAVAAAVAIYLLAGGGSARDFAAVYVIERSLSLDNLFLFLLILGYFQVPDDSRRKVIVWGIAAALVLRAAAIAAGVALVETLQPVVYVLGAGLVYLAYRVLRGFTEEFDPLRTPFVRAVRRLVPLTGFHGDRLTVREEGQLRATPLLLALSAVVFADIAFAIDSVPAALAITRETLVIWVANGFALVGLLALLTLLDDLLRSFRYLDETIGIILAFVGIKLLLEEVVPIGDLLTLAVIGGALVLGIVASLVADRLSPEPATVAKARTPPRCPPALTLPLPAAGEPASGSRSADAQRRSAGGVRPNKTLMAARNPAPASKSKVTQRAEAFRPRWPEAPDPSCTPRMHGGTRSGKTPPRAHADQGWS